jgi:hypothetical protein
MKLTVEIDGFQMPFEECRWIRIDPTGCVDGSVLPVCGTDIVGSPQDAHTHFTPRARDRDREARQGWRHELVSHDRWKAEAEPCLRGKCEHRAGMAGPSVSGAIP